MKQRILAMALGLAAAAQAQTVPTKVSFNARLVDTAGAPVSGPHTLQFTLFTASTGGTNQWQESYGNAVFGSDGTIAMTLGSTAALTPAIFSGPELYLEISVDNQVMQPRVSIVSVPYALRASSAGTADSVGSLSAANVQHSIVNSCTGTQAISTIAPDGTVTCQTIPTSVGVDTGCPGPKIQGVCLLGYNNLQSTSFQTAAQTCANLGGDLCTDSQSYPLAVGWNRDRYLGQTVLVEPHWTASFADNDTVYWSASNGGTGDNHGANTSYGYACCGGYRPPNPRVPTQTSPSGVRYTALHDLADTEFSGAVAYCGSLDSDLCSDSQTYLLRQDGLVSAATWTNSHADNDGSLYNAINGGTIDDTHPSHRNGFACCPSLRPADLSCPVARTSGVCQVYVSNTNSSTFDQAATACASRGADLCSMGQAAVLRVAAVLTTTKVWTNSHSDNDGSNAASAVGSAMPDNPNLVSDLSGFACCIN